jgi:hypothetical protein
MCAFRAAQGRLNRQGTLARTPIVEYRYDDHGLIIVLKHGPEATIMETANAGIPTRPG